MTANPFTAFVFDAAGETQSPNTRTLPDRLAEIKNVRDFGAVGDGVTDDWAAIMAAFNWGQVTLVVSGTPSGNVIPFASVPSSVLAFQMYANDVTNPSAIPGGGAPVVGVTPTTITLANAGSVSSGDTLTINWIAKGAIYFPPGTYLVSQPLKFYDEADANITGIYFGELGASTITGNFADYVIIQAASQTASSGTVIDKLNITNTNAAGGGIRLGSTLCGAIRDCTIIANQGISDYGSDSGGPYFGSFEITIENCNLSPGSNVSGSQGIMKQSDGPITNCRVVGYATGFLGAGEEGAQFLSGCYFQQCGVAALLGTGPNGSLFSISGVVIAGCWFKNNSTAIYCTKSPTLCTFKGVCIEGADGQAPGSANCQYGIRDDGGQMGNSVIAGVTVTGQYDIAAIKILSQNGPRLTTYMAVQCANSSATGGAKTWDVEFVTPTGNPWLPQFVGCSGAGMPFIYNVANLAALNVGECFNVSDGTNSLAWGATVTNTGTHATHYKARYNGSNFTVVGQ